jgi:hypothetical protein
VAAVNAVFVGTNDLMDAEANRILIAMGAVLIGRLGRGNSICFPGFHG